MLTLPMLMFGCVCGGDTVKYRFSNLRLYINNYLRHSFPSSRDESSSNPHVRIVKHDGNLYFLGLNYAGVFQQLYADFYLLQTLLTGNSVGLPTTIYDAETLQNSGSQVYYLHMYQPYELFDPDNSSTYAIKISATDELLEDWSYDYFDLSDMLDVEGEALPSPLIEVVE